MTENVEALIARLRTNQEHLIWRAAGDAIRMIEQLQATLTASLAAEKRARADAIEGCARTADVHRQELFDDGLEADTVDMAPFDAFLAGCTQERESIANAIRALVHPPDSLAVAGSTADNKRVVE